MDINILSEEARFWKARSVVYSIIQHITYSEWLPALLGSQTHLLQTTPELGDGLRITNSFAITAYRFGHSMVGDTLGPFQLQNLFFQPNFLQTNGIETVINAAIATTAQQADAKVVNTLRNILFADINKDLVALNLFRGRETGIGTYQQINQCYKTVGPWVDDVRDALRGMLQEELVQGSSLSKTVGTIVAEQFKRLRKYDDNFYTKKVQQIGPLYYNLVTSTTLSSLIQRNTAIGPLKSNVFYSH